MTDTCQRCKNEKPYVRPIKITCGIDLSKPTLRTVIDKNGNGFVSVCEDCRFNFMNNFHRWFFMEKQLRFKSE